ncbi:MAG TPA: exosortase/archaeosortase family protein [Gemmatimonadaceae bacterium]
MPWLIALVASLAWLYAATALNLVREWGTNADASYGLLLTAVAVWLLSRRRQPASFTIRSRRADAAALALLVVGLLIYLVGQLAADVFATRVSMVLVVAGVTLFSARNVAPRTLMAPFLFLLIAIPLPELVVNSVTLPLQLVASRIAEFTLAAVSIPVFREGNLLTLPSSTLEVAEACSGLRSIVSLGAIAVMLAWMLRRGVVARVALVAATVPIAVIMNGLRIAATGVVVERWGPAFGKGAWHDFTGWITFVASLAVLIAIQRRMNRAFPRGTEGSERSAPQGWAAA